MGPHWLYCGQRRAGPGITLRPRKERNMKTFSKYIPNALSSFRIIAVPFLFVIAWQGHPELFLAVLALSFVSDAVDGILARRLKVASETGTRLDSWGDFLTYVTLAICAWRLWPEVFLREGLYVVTGIVLYLIPVAANFIKFRKLPSYHTWAAKIQAVLMCIALYLLLLLDIAWPFQCAVILQFFVSIEEIAITLLLTEEHCNIPSFWHLVQVPARGQSAYSK